MENCQQNPKMKIEKLKKATIIEEKFEVDEKFNKFFFDKIADCVISQSECHITCLNNTR